MHGEPVTNPALCIRDDPATQAALGIIAYSGSMATHEVLGHGVACIALGGHNLMLSGWAESCSISSRVITAAGPLLQFVAGLLAWMLLRCLPARAPYSLRAWLWLSMTFDLLISSGYVAFSAVTNFGDAAKLIAGFTPALLWRSLLFVLGGGLYYATLWIKSVEMRHLQSAAGPARVRRFVWPAYLAAGLLAVGAGLLSRTQPRGPALELAVASSWGAGIGMVLLIDLPFTVQPATAPGGRVIRSVGWLIAGTVIGLFFLLVLGPGVRLTAMAHP